MTENYPLLSQERLPALWKIFQWTIGGTVDKRKMVLLKYRGQKEILGVGCSIGNVAKAFLKFPELHYTGLDIDANAIECARKDFRSHKNFSFVCADLTTFAETEKKKFDFILFEGMAHHVDDTMLVSLLTSAQKLLAKDGVLTVVDPLTPNSEDGWFTHWYRKLERGKYVRSFDELKDLLLRVPTLKLVDSEVRVVGATPLSLPACSRFVVFSTRSATH